MTSSRVYFCEAYNVWHVACIIGADVVARLAPAPFSQIFWPQSSSYSHEPPPNNSHAKRNLPVLECDSLQHKSNKKTS